MRRVRHVVEYLFVRILISFVHITPMCVVRLLSKALGRALFYVSKKRRGIAIDNISMAYSGSLSGATIRKIALQSCQSLILTFLEGIKFTSLLNNPEAILKIAEENKELTHLFKRAGQMHLHYGGCIFVTPHLGNWEFLPHVSAAVGIPLTVVARPLDNPYLERLLYQSRVSSGQLLIPKRNALFKLQQTLQKKRSIGLLPDQSTMKGINVTFFGRTATATPIPALLAVTYKRPIVVTACCRDEVSGSFTGFVSDPIMPGDNTNERAEVLRLTQEMTNKMEEVIRLYPSQYLWMHNRWKTYS